MPQHASPSSGARHESAEELERRMGSMGGIGAVNSDSQGTVVWCRHGAAGVTGLAEAPIGGVVHFEGGAVGLLCALDRHNVFAMLLSGGRVHEGESVTLAAASLQVPVGPAMIGRNLDGLGNCLAGEPIESGTTALKMAAPAPALARTKVARQLFTGLPALDFAAPLGVGQSLLLHGVEGSGKSAAARSIVAAQLAAGSQTGKAVHCIYVAIGGDAKRRISALPSEMAPFMTTLAAGSDVSDGQRTVAPYVASAIASESAACGCDVLLIYDNLSSHATAASSIAAALGTPAALAEPKHAAMLHQASNGPSGGSVSVIGLLQTTMKGDSTEQEPLLLEAADQSLSFSAPLWQQVWLGRMAPAWQSHTAGALGTRIKQGLVTLESMGSVAQVRRSIFGSNEDDPSDSANHKSLEQLAALLEFKPKEGGQSNATQAVSVLAGLANVDAAGRLIGDVDPRKLGVLQAQLLEHLNNDHAEVMQGLEKGFKLPGNAADEIVDVATQVIVKWLKSKQADNKVYL